MESQARRSVRQAASAVTASPVTVTPVVTPVFKPPTSDSPTRREWVVRRMLRRSALMSGPAKHPPDWDPLPWYTGAMPSEIVQVRGHIIDSLILPKVLDEIMDLNGTFEILDVAIGKRKTDTSMARLRVQAESARRLEQILKRIARLGAAPLHLHHLPPS